VTEVSPLEDEQSQAQSSGRTALKFFLRAAVGAAVFAFVVLRKPAELGHALSQAQLWWAVGAAAAIFTGLFFSALRWGAYLDALGLHLRAPTLFRLYLVGTFFNAFLPTGVGGDAYKAMRIARARGHGAEAFASVFLDRFAGFMGLTIVGLVGIAGDLIAGEKHRHVLLLGGVMCLGMLFAALVLLLGGEKLLGRGRLVRRHGIGGKIRRTVAAIHEAARHPAAAARGYVFGIAFQMLVLANHMMVARALGITTVSVGAMAAIVVISSLATMIPITINGLGFREAVYVASLAAFKVPAGTARAFGLLIFAILLATSIAGGLVYVTRGGEVPAER
jgi:uncharacterized protein (TIRG00374 family)